MRLASRYAVRLALVASLFGLWLFAGVGRSYACSCVEPDPPAEALANSTVVFAGRVVAIRGFDIPESGIVSSADLGTIELQVSTVWKGPVQETMFVTTVRNGASCGFTFAEGEEYVIYSRSDATPPEVSLCSRTRLAANAQEDFDALGEGSTPEPGSRAPEPTATPTLTPTPEPTATPTLTPTPEPTPPRRANPTHARANCYADSSTCHRGLQHPLAVRPRAQGHLGIGADRRGRPTRLAQATTHIKPQPALFASVC